MVYSRETRVTVSSLERLENSDNGNPRYKIHTDNGPYRSVPDAGFCYGIESQRIPGAELQEATLTLDSRGRVENLVWHPIVGNRWPGDCDHDRDLCSDCIMRCRPCGNTYDTAEALELHVANDHPSEHGCKHCGRPHGH